MSCFRTATSTDVNDDADFTTLLNPLGVVLRETPTAGRGVFATQDIPAVGTVVERSPVLVLTKEEWERGRLGDGELGGYAFSWSQGGMAIGLGIASMFNHSPTPNVNFIRSIPTSRNPETQPSLIFKTFRPIKAGEELFICYAADDSRLWFSPDYVQPKSTSKDEPYANADAGPSSRSPQRAMTVEDELPPFPQAIDSLSDSEAPSKAARRDRRKREREEKRRKWQEKNAEKEKRRVADAAAVGGGANGDLALVNGSSETGVDRTPGDGTPNEISEEAYQAALEALDMVEQVDITHEQVAIEDADQEDSFYPGWSKAPRIKGRIETEQDDDSRTMDVWSVDLDDTRLFKVVLDFVRTANLPQDEIRHLKRIRKETSDSQNAQVVLCPAPHIGQSDLVALIKKLAPRLAERPLERSTVPACYATDLDELARKNQLWPVIFSQRPPQPVDTPWSASRRAWVRQGINRIVDDALAATARGELPIATHVACPPGPARILKEGDIPPTPYIRASAHDTRQSANHPLRHAALNCIANVARLRTVWPASATLGTRNGADYLLTSLSLFITHEPCLMCTMALLHSRVKEIFYILPSPHGDGGFNSTFGVHGHPQLNHQVDVFDCSALVSADRLRALALPNGCNV